MKIDRLIGILIMLVNKKKITARQLSDYYEVSIRTIQRDMDTLSSAGVPLYADVGVNGGYQLLDNYKLEKGFLNKSEANFLFPLLKNLEETSPSDELKSIYNKFSSLSENNMQENKFIIKLNPSDDSTLFKEHLKIISQARDKQYKIAITYYNNNFNESRRIICPYTIIMLGSYWYVYGYCDLRSDFRMFKISRIIKCVLTNEYFKLKELPLSLPWENDFSGNKKSELIILELDKKLLGNLSDYFNRDTCEILKDKIVVTFHFPVDEWIYTLIMSLVPYVKIIEPDYLRIEFLNRLKKSINDNNYDI